MCGVCETLDGLNSHCASNRGPRQSSSSAAYRRVVRPRSERAIGASVPRRSRFADRDDAVAAGDVGSTSLLVPRPTPHSVHVVYRWCMARTNLDIDERACALVMRRYGLSTKRDAVNFALRELAAELSVDEARRLRGSGWEGDLEQIRTARAAEP